MQQGAARAHTARAGRAAPAGVGDRGGTGGGGSGGRGRWMEGGGDLYRAPAGPTTLQSGGAAAGVLWAPPGGLQPPPCGSGVGEGRQRPLAAMTHGAWEGRYDTCNAMMRVAGGRGARPGPPPRAGGPLVRKAAVRRRLRQPTSGASLPERGGAGEWGGGGGTACMLGGGGLWAGGWVRVRGGRGCGELSRRASPCGRPGGGAAGAGQSRPGSPGRSWCRGGRGQRWGPHPARRGRIPPSIIHGGESWWRRGGAPRRPLAAEPDRDGPRRMDTGGAGGAGHRGSGARVLGGCGPARGRPGRPLGCGW